MGLNSVLVRGIRVAEYHSSRGEVILSTARKVKPEADFPLGTYIDGYLVIEGNKVVIPRVRPVRSALKLALLNYRG